jgi:hypothetical protein
MLDTACGAFTLLSFEDRAMKQESDPKGPPNQPTPKEAKPESIKDEFLFVFIFAGIVALILLARALGIF